MFKIFMFIKISNLNLHTFTFKHTFKHLTLTDPHMPQDKNHSNTQFHTIRTLQTHTHMHITLLNDIHIHHHIVMCKLRLSNRGAHRVTRMPAVLTKILQNAEVTFEPDNSVLSMIEQYVSGVILKRKFSTSKPICSDIFRLSFAFTL